MAEMVQMEHQIMVLAGVVVLVLWVLMEQVQQAVTAVLEPQVLFQVPL